MFDELINPPMDDRTFYRLYERRGDAYMRSRRKAEAVALDLAMQSQQEAYDAQSPEGKTHTKAGKVFFCYGKWDCRHGIQFFALDYESEADRADVDQFIKEQQQ